MHKHIRYAVSLLSCLIALTIKTTNTVNASNLSFSAELGNSLSLSLSSNAASLTLDPLTAPFATTSITATTKTNNETGYNIMVTTSTTDLTRTEALADTTVPVIPTLETLAGGYTENTFTVNHWGYNKGSGNWLPFETSIELGRNTGPTNLDTKTMNFAAKVDYTKPSGAYDITLNFVAVANPLPAKAMQTVNQAYLESFDVDDVVTLRDVRANHEEYEVTVIEMIVGEDPVTYDDIYAKAFWMNSNLKLPAGTTLTSADSNVSSDFTLTNTSWQDTKFVQQMAVANGVYYYNWYAATANPSTSGEYNDGASKGDICPKGWRLPTSSELRRHLSGSTAALNTHGLEGYYRAGIVEVSGRFGYVWGGTADGQNNAYTTYKTPNSTYLDWDAGSKALGHPVRCIFLPE